MVGVSCEKQLLLKRGVYTHGILAQPSWAGKTETAFGPIESVEGEIESLAKMFGGKGVILADRIRE